MMLLLSGIFFAASAVVCVAYLIRSQKKYQNRQDMRKAEICSLEQAKQEMVQKQIEKEAKRQEEERQCAFEEKRVEYTKLYGGKPPESFCDIPQWVEIGVDGLPKERGAVDWGYKFTYYKSSGGKCAHKKRGCCGVTHPIHAWQIPPGTRLCSKCYKELPDMAWYKEYLHIKHIKQTYNID